jgi:outer membrane protein assembly factor BamB
MKYNIIDTVEGIYSSLKIESDYITFYRKDKRFYLYNLDMDLLVKIDFDLDYPYKMIDDCIYFSCINRLKKLDICNNKFNDLLITDSEFITIINKELIITSIYNTELNIEQSKIIILLDGRELWSFDEWLILLNIEGFLLFSSRRKNTLYLKDVYTGKEIWNYNLCESKVYGNVLKYYNTLIIPLENNHLLGINAQTGEKLWELEDCFHHYNLDEQTGLLYGYGAERYEIIDTVKGEKILQKQFEGSMDKYNIFVSQHMNTLSGDGLYFTSNDSVIKFGKINIRTHEIEFVQELVEDKERIGRANASKPIYHNGRLYILDSVGTLHIFEEES